MKTIIKETCENGIDSLLGERVTLFCARYIYTGVMSAVDEDRVLLSDAGVVFDTGDFQKKEWNDCQKLPNDWYVQLSAVESFGILK